MKAPEVGLEMVSSGALLNTHVSCAFSVLNTKVCAKVLYAHIWIQKDVKLTMNGISEDTVIFLYIESLLVSNEQLVYCYHSTLLELGMPRTGLEYVFTFCFLELSLHKQQKMFTAESLSVLLSLRGK